MMSEVEEKYSCTGYCEAGLFWFTKPVSEGAPDFACDQAIEEKEGNGPENYLVKL